MKYVVFQGVNGHPSVLEGILEVEADKHVCLGNFIANDLRLKHCRDGTLECLALAQRQMQLNQQSGKALDLMRDQTENAYLRELAQKKDAKISLGGELTEFIRQFYLRIQRDDFGLVFEPWLPWNGGIAVNDPDALSKKTDNEKKLYLLTDKDMAHHYGTSVHEVMKRLYPFSSRHFTYFIGKWRSAVAWELRSGLPKPKIIHPSRYGKGSIRSATFVLEDRLPTVIFPGSAELGHYCTYDTSSRELTIFHDNNISFSY